MYIAYNRDEYAHVRETDFHSAKSRTDQYRIKPNILRSMRTPIRQTDHRQKSPNGENYKKYKTFKIITKVVEHRGHAD